MKVSIGYRHRSVPVAWTCYPPDRPPEPMPRLLWRLMRRVARCLPPGAAARVTFVADRGLSWPAVLDACGALGWHYVLRIQGQTHVITDAGGAGDAGDDDDGQECQAAQLAPRPGGPGWSGPARVFKKAGWRRANVVAVWDRRCAEPWLLVTDLPASAAARCRNYARRAWCEQLHRDEKSAGFNWQRSRVRRPSHADRLLLAVALATLLALSLGTRVLKAGYRRFLESRRARRMSVFQLGLRWLAAGQQASRS